MTKTLTKPLILLDRDGVINHDSDDFIKSQDEWIAIDGSLQAIAELTKHGLQIAVITNQSGVGRGLFTLPTLNAIHAKMHKQIEQAGGKIAALAYCPHQPHEGCNCRKPNIGLVEQIKAKLNIDAITSAYLVGDSFKDIEVAIKVAAVPILVKTGKGERTIQAHPELDCLILPDLLTASKHIISQLRPLHNASAF